MQTYPAAAAAGWRFSFVGPAGGSLDGLRGALRDVPRTEYIGAPVRGGVCRLAAAVRSLLRDGGFALLHSHGLRAAAHAAAANVGFGVPHVATLHEPLRPAQFMGLRGRLRRWALGRLLRRPDAVAVPSEDSRADLVACFPALAARAVTVPDGICPADYDVLRRRRPGGTTMGFFGDFTPEHGFPALLEAVRRVAANPAVPPFLVAAFGPAEGRPAAQLDVERLGLSDCVTLRDAPLNFGPVLRQLDLIVAPSGSAEACLAAMEAMAAGVPVLGVDAPGLREVLRGTPSRTVAACDADALHDGLHFALTRPWAEAAGDYTPAARDRFDASRAARRLIDLFDRLTGAASECRDQGSEWEPIRIAA
jgi:glycosyltransferase involved in cell wall biosynthesis